MLKPEAEIPAEAWVWVEQFCVRRKEFLNFACYTKERGEGRRLLFGAVHCESLSPITPLNFQKVTNITKCLGSSGVHTLDLCACIYVRGKSTAVGASNRCQAEPRHWQGCRGRGEGAPRDTTIGEASNKFSQISARRGPS